VGILAPFRRRRSLSRAIPRVQRFLVAVSLTLYAAFTAVTTWRMLATPFRLGR
jgi:hypothetical protein